MTNDKNYQLLSQLTKHVVVALTIALTTLAFSNISFALSTDRDQPADIDADDVEIDFKTGKRIFNGNVRVIQGTLRIKADKIIANYKDGELVDATAYGSPAKFRQRPDGKPDDVEGEGKTIYVNEKNNTITLKKNASLKQGFDTARGQEIFYNMANDTLKVKGGADLGRGKNKNKLKDDAFFKDKPKPATTNTTNGSKTITEAPAAVKRPADELPEKLILPKKQATTTTTSSGRSRLIIVPK